MNKPTVKSYQVPWREIWLFGLSGVTNAAVYLLVSLLFISIYPTQVFIATTLGYFSSLVVSFVMNATLTFEKGSVTSAPQAAKYLCLYAVGYGYNMLVIGYGTSILQFPFWATVLLVTATWPFASFLAGKFLVFR